MDITPKTQATKEKINLGIVKIKNFCASKDTINRMKTQLAEMEKYLQIIYIIRDSSTEFIKNTYDSIIKNLTQNLTKDLKRNFSKEGIQMADKYMKHIQHHLSSGKCKSKKTQ